MTWKKSISNLLPFPIPALFADQELPLDADGAEILSETFNVLSLKEMKLQALSNAAGGAKGEEQEEEEKMATLAKAVLQAAQRKVVSQVGGRVIASLYSAEKLMCCMTRHFS